MTFVSSNSQAQRSEEKKSTAVGYFQLDKILDFYQRKKALAILLRFEMFGNMTKHHQEF